MYLVSNVKRCKNYNVPAMSGMLRCLRVRGYAHTVLKLDLTTIIFYYVALMIFFSPFTALIRCLLNTLLVANLRIRCSASPAQPNARLPIAAF